MYEDVANWAVFWIALRCSVGGWLLPAVKSQVSTNSRTMEEGQEAHSKHCLVYSKNECQISGREQHELQDSPKNYLVTDPRCSG